MPLGCVFLWEIWLREGDWWDWSWIQVVELVCSWKFARSIDSYYTDIPLYRWWTWSFQAHLSINPMLVLWTFAFPPFPLWTYWCCMRFQPESVLSAPFAQTLWKIWFLRWILLWGSRWQWALLLSFPSMIPLRFLWAWIICKECDHCFSQERW